MGDRVSIAFRNKEWNNEPDDGVTLFHHWGGREFPELALQYAKELKLDMNKHQQGFSTPLSRFEPRVVMLDFIRWLLEKGFGKYQNRINDSLYLGKSPNDGDNSDNGHWIIDLEKLEFVHTKGEYESEFEPEEE